MKATNYTKSIAAILFHAAALYTISGTSFAQRIDSISPDTVDAGGSQFTLNVTGAGFYTTRTTGTPISAKVLWNNQELSTTWVNSQRLTATVPASLIRSSGRVTIKVRNRAGIPPHNSDFFSNEKYLDIRDPQPPPPTITPITRLPFRNTFRLDGPSISGFRGNGYYADFFSISVTRTTVVVINVSSQQFDPYIYLTRPGVVCITFPCNAGLVAENNDADHGTRNSRIRITLQPSVTYYLEVTSNLRNASGNYELSVEEENTLSAPPDIGVLSSVRYDQELREALAPRYYSLGRTNRHYANYYKFRGRRGDRIYIELSSSTFDPYLILRNSHFEKLREDNDGGTGSNARIPAESGFYTLPYDDDYILEITSWEAGHVGSFVLKIVFGATDPSQHCQQVDFGSSRDGRIDSESNRWQPSGTPGNCYYFDGRADDEIVITISSHDFDGHVFLLDQHLQAIDHAGPAREPRLPSSGSFRLPSHGRYYIIIVVRVHGYHCSYRFQLTRSGGSGGSHDELTLHRTVRGTLNRNSEHSRYLDGSYADTYVITLTGHEVLTMQSHEVDCFLVVFTESGDVVAYNDDSDGTNSRIDLSRLRPGRYFVEASTFGIGETGSYEILFSR